MAVEMRYARHNNKGWACLLQVINNKRGKERRLGASYDTGDYQILRSMNEDAMAGIQSPLIYLGTQSVVRDSEY